MSSTTTPQPTTATASLEATPDTPTSPGATGDPAFPDSTTTESPTSSILTTTEATTAATSATTTASPPTTTPTPGKSTFTPNGVHRQNGNYDSKTGPLVENENVFTSICI